MGLQFLPAPHEATASDLAASPPAPLTGILLAYPSAGQCLAWNAFSPSVFPLDFRVPLTWFSAPGQGYSTPVPALGPGNQPHGHRFCSKSVLGNTLTHILIPAGSGPTRNRHLCSFKCHRDMCEQEGPWAATKTFRDWLQSEEGKPPSTQHCLQLCHLDFLTVRGPPCVRKH